MRLFVVEPPRIVSSRRLVNGLERMPLSANTRLGPYEIVSMLGVGGMGEVYRARDSRLNRDVAIKILREDGTAGPDLRSRFEREARAVAALNHPNIVSVYDFGIGSGQQYIVSELLDGESLRSLLKGKPLPIRKLIDIGAQVADGGRGACRWDRPPRPQARKHHARQRWHE